MEPTPRSADPPAGPISVLVVGDPNWRTPLVADLSAADETLVTTAARGHDGYEWLTAQPGEVDCIVCSLDLVDMSGVRFLEVVRAAYPDLPVVLLASDGDEATASRAVAADVTEYVPVDDRPSLTDDLLRRVRRAAVRYRTARARRRRARQFDALFDDPRTFMWVLDPSGAIRRTNRTALDFLDAPATSVVDASFADSPWWERSETTPDEIRDALRTARNGSVTRFETAFGAPDGRVELDVSFRPVTDRDGAIVSVVVEALDVSERANLERELRESEELHRVTLNNMTDTVLVTDDSGEFTYICPNVHYIFGYSVEEIRDLGRIDALLGDDLFDRETLDSQGLLTNIECTATDRAGREHTLLVNVKRVSIQGGTTLYSCRDITKRKDRERALTALHRTSRDLLYAETTPEIASLVIDDVTDIFDVDECAVYLFDTDANELWPAAATDAIESLSGPLPTVRLDESSALGRAFVDRTTLTFDDVTESDAFPVTAVERRSGLFIPLSDHGVFVAADERGTLDEVTREIIDLLAATVEAALDRIEREDELRERDRELHRRNRQLSRLNRTNEIIREIDRALVRADSREEIEAEVCELLTASDRFEFAWVGDTDPGSGDLEPRSWAGDDRGYLDAADFTARGDPAGRTAAADSVTVVPNVADDLQDTSWRREAISRGFQSILSVPLTHGDVAYGTLSVYAGRPNAFDDRARTVLSELGETIASAIQSVERKRALVSDTVVELDYRITDENCVLHALSRRAECALELQGGVRELDSGARILVAVSGGSPSEVAAAANAIVAVESVRVVSSDDEGGLVQLTLTAPFIATRLAESGATLERLRSDGGDTTATVFVPSPVAVRTIDDVLSNAYPSSELVARRERERPTDTGSRFRDGFLSDITHRQLEVVQTAYYSGYFESPRANDGAAVAAMLDISSAAFYEHMRKVQRKLLAAVFDRIPSVPNGG
ncbi:bacterio-opsin activator domain-containing protein [Haladaptatus sp. T7]|uniref:bacterio-opsin activator domain-containing protein n=1 Tax=Haladaptatus sp. T7 TaxID=2029368 RepID=UPI0021A259F3|nr:bacterio-opsin activator domain-containing protein [Haladaptatus sp. T7]GKZ15816.1 XRE family transcriptional regulator [Haladaptatus sp. T7]